MEEKRTNAILDQILMTFWDDSSRRQYCYERTPWIRKKAKDAILALLDAARHQGQDEAKAASPNPLDAARAIVERWDTPAWKEVEPTANLINRLRVALGTKAASVHGNETREVLLFCSYCGPEETDCTDAKPCADCLGMSNIYRIDERAIDLKNYRRQLGEIGLADDQIRVVDRLTTEIANLRARAKRARQRHLKAVSALQAKGAK